MILTRRSRIVTYRIAGLALIIVGAGWLHHVRVERAYANAFLLASVSKLAVDETSLRLLDENRIDTAREILQKSLHSSLDSAEGHLSAGARMQPYFVLTHESLLRAAEHQRATGNAEVASRIEELDKALRSRQKQGDLPAVVRGVRLAGCRPIG